MTSSRNGEGSTRTLRFCVWDPSNRTSYTGGEMLKAMYSSCSDDRVKIECDVFAIAYHHFPSMSITLKNVDDYIERAKPHKNVTPFVPQSLLPSADKIVDFMLSNYDALIIGGSDDDATEDLPYLKLAIDVMRKLIEVDMPFMGYCIGGQLLARITHGENAIHKLSHVNGEEQEYGFISYKMTDLAKRIPLFKNVKDGFVSTALHHDCFLVDEHDELLLSSEQCPCAAFQAKGKRAFGFQFHLDFTKKEGEKFFRMECPNATKDADEPDLDSSRVIIRNFIYDYVIDGKCY
jgi:GMP synthase-like glutamine amidotransferase